MNLLKFSSIPISKNKIQCHPLFYVLISRQAQIIKFDFVTHLVSMECHKNSFQLVFHFILKRIVNNLFEVILNLPIFYISLVNLFISIRISKATLFIRLNLLYLQLEQVEEIFGIFQNSCHKFSTFCFYFINNQINVNSVQYNQH